MNISFHDDINLISLNAQILEKLETDIAESKKYEDEIERLNVIIKEIENPSDKTIAMEKKKKIESILFSIKNNKYISMYKEKIDPILLEYKKICGTSRVFGMDTCTDIPKRVGIIIQFLEKAKEFIHIEWECSFNMSRICPKCYGSTKKCASIMICTNKDCNFSYEIIKVPNIGNITNSSKSESTYQAAKNYKKEYMHLCGLINNSSKDQITDIDEYLYRNGIHNKTRADIRDAIHACGYNNYNDINYIYSEITKEPLPPIEKYMSVCIERFKLYFDVFESSQSLGIIEGSNITNIHFLTKLFLWQEGVSYDPTWFRQLADMTEKRHIRNAKKVCDILKSQNPQMNWSYPSEWNKI